MHTYKVRPGYGSDKLMIEFGASSSDEQFIADLKAVFATHECRKQGTEDMVFLVTITFDSPAGLFQLDYDEWGFVFLHADRNQPAIHYLDEILLSSGLFKKEHVDFKDYAQPGGAPKSRQPLRPPIPPENRSSDPLQKPAPSGSG